MNNNQVPKFKTQTKQNVSVNDSNHFLSNMSNKVLASILAGTVLIGGITGYAAMSLLSGNSKEVNQQDTTTKNGDSNTVGYKVIKEDVPQFDEVPIAAYDQGYVVKVDNHFGFIDPEGNYKIDPDYEVITRAINDNENGGYYYCGFPTLGDSPSLNGGTNFGYLLDVDGDDMQSCGNTGIGGTGSFIYTYDGKNVQIKKTTESADISGIDKTPKRTVAINATNYTSFEEYYIYVPETNEGFGPYKNEEVPNFDLEEKGLSEHKQVGDFQTINLGIVHSQPVVNGIFWAHEDGQYRIVSEYGEKSEDLYDEAKVISNDSILVKKGNQVGIVDENLKFVDLKDTSIEEMSKPIDGKCFIKKDGKWMLVEVGAGKSSVDKSENEKETEVEIEEQEEEVVEETMEDEFAEEEASGRKVLTGTVRKIYDRATLVELSGAQQDPNPDSDRLDTDCLIILDEPQYIPISDSVGGINSNNEITMFSVQGANIPDSYDGKRIIFSYDPYTASLAQDTSLPMRQPRTTDIKILETLQ